MNRDDFDFLAVQGLQPELYFSGADIDSISSEKIKDLEKEIADRSFKPILHAPFFDLNPGAFDPKVRILTADRILWALDTAKQFGASQVVIHPGYGQWIFSKNFSSWFARAKETLEKILVRAKSNNVKIAVENIYDIGPEDISALISEFPKDQIGFCFDVGHFNLFSQNSTKLWLDVLGERLFEIHLHDNLGGEDDHIAVGDGTIKFGSLVAWLKCRETMPVITLEMEQKTHVIKSVSRVKEWFESKKE